MRISSKSNETVKNINKLKQKKYRTEMKMYIAEGKKISYEAMKYQKDNIFKIIVSESFAKKNNIPKESIIVDDDVYMYLTEDKNPEGMLSVLKMPEKKELDYTDSEIIILDEIRDPGNLGTIIRTLDAVGKKQIVITGDSVDPFMPKVVRASMGSVFRINIIEKELNEIIYKLKEKNYQIVGADMHGEDIFTMTKGKYAIIFGNEASGLNEETKIALDKTIKIPIAGETESLNLSMSVGIIAYEFYRKDNYGTNIR